ncbi:MAG: class I SAM-dependent methyltransferase [Candidatus Hodarchaeota archaeon]
MNLLQITLIIIGFIIALILIFGLPRKKISRIPSIEGLDIPEVAAAFERMTNFLPFKLLRRKVLSKLKLLKPTGKLVDAGCGSGNLIVQIAKTLLDLDLIGVDISDEVLNLAKKRVIKNDLSEKIEFKLGNVEDLPFSDNSIDFLLSTLSLHHWQDPIRAFNEFFRVLRKDGTLLIFDFRRDARKFFYGLLKFATKIVVPKALKRINEPLGSLQAGYTPQEIRKLISKSLFNNIEIESFLAWIFIKMKK